MRHHDHVSTTTPTPTGRPNARLAQTVGDMVRSLAVVFAAVGVVLFLSYRSSPDPVREVDITSPLTVATLSAPYPVLVPTAIDGYRLTSARWQREEPPVWHLGYVTPDTTYVQVEQSATTKLKFLEQELTGTRPEPAVEINGSAWILHAGASQNALVRTIDGVTTAVSGTAPVAELTAVAASLTPGMQKPQSQ